MTDLSEKRTSETAEDILVDFIRSGPRPQTPPAVFEVARNVIRTVFGTMIAGSGEEGIAELRDVILYQGGRKESRSIIFGDTVPASQAAMLNASMARALDYCDVMDAGLHLGSAVVPAVLAAAEIRGASSGKDFLEAIVVGLEVGAHLNLKEEEYRGLDPTGVAGLLGATAAVANILRLGKEEVHNAMAIAFNRCSGSFQSNVDASLGVRLIQGFSASSAIQSVQLAQAGLTGPENFLSGQFGYAQLFGRGTRKPRQLVEELGFRWDMLGILFKKFPCCGLAQGLTQSTLELISEYEIEAEDLVEVEVKLREFPIKLIGRPFEVGNSPKVNAQFSAQYCIANAVLRRDSKLVHFTPDAVRAISDNPLINKITVSHSNTLKSHAGSTVLMRLNDGRQLARTLEMAPGYSLTELDAEQTHRAFWDCIDYSESKISSDDAESLDEKLSHLDATLDVRELLDLAMESQNSPATL